MSRRWLLVVALAPLCCACEHSTQEEPFVDSGLVACEQQNVLDGSVAFTVRQAAECFGQLPDGGPDFGAVTLQLAADSITCESEGGSVGPVCSGAGVGSEVYLQYGTSNSPEAVPLTVGTWNVTSVDGGPWITVFLTDNVAGHEINAQSGQVILSTLSNTQLAGQLDSLVFSLPDGGQGTLSGSFCTAFCGVLPDGG